MLQEISSIIQKGDDNGNGMVIKISLPSGLTIFGLPTENNYGTGWDLGPTWNFLVMGDKPFLVDTGKDGTSDMLIDMISLTGLSPEDIHAIVVSHGHEDHDGGLFEFSRVSSARIRAHEIYARLILPYPDHAPEAYKRSFPASCWRCSMPQSFVDSHCLQYHRERADLTIEPIQEGDGDLGEDVSVYHLPGHSPDALALLVGRDALLVGDTILPEITPAPSREGVFESVRNCLDPRYDSADTIYGLLAYLRSLKRLKGIAKTTPDLLILFAHRLFYDGHWNDIQLEERIHELIQHHMERCAAILKILQKGPLNERQIAEEHFDEKLLEGYGILMAENEVLSHCELMNHSGDVIRGEDGNFQATGSSNFASFIEDLAPQ